MKWRVGRSLWLVHATTPSQADVVCLLTVKTLILAFALVMGVTFMASAADSPEATTFQIRNVKYPELLRPRDANSANGTPIVLYPARPWNCMTWRLKPTGISFSIKEFIHIKNVLSKR